MTKWLFGTLLYCLTFTAFAGSQQYQIEVLIFSHMTEKTLSQEQWPVIPPVENPITDNTTNPALTTVDPSQFILKNEAQKLAAQPQYRVLYHAAWQTSAYALASPQTIYIQNGDSDLGNSELNGSIKISLDRYFDTDLQLYLNEPTSRLKSIASNPAFASAPSTFHFLLNQKRRMRSKELNYIAQPVFGALIKIIPIKINSNG